MKSGVLFKASALTVLLCASMGAQASHYITEVINNQSDNCDVRAIWGGGTTIVYEVDCPNDTVYVQAQWSYDWQTCQTSTNTAGYYTQDYGNRCDYYRIYPDS